MSESICFELPALRALYTYLGRCQTYGVPRDPVCGRIKDEGEGEFLRHDTCGRRVRGLLWAALSEGSPGDRQTGSHRHAELGLVGGVALWWLRKPRAAIRTCTIAR